MPRLLVAECLHEVCSFNPVPTRYEDFFVHSGADVFGYHDGLGTEVAGAREVFAARPDLDVVPVWSARGIASGGTIPAADWDRIAREFLDSLRAAGPADAAYFALHGAMAAENEDDPEGHLLAEARRILGPHVPIVASFDLHGILTDRILREADAIVVYHTYPHVDFAETGRRAARLLLRILDDGVRPVTARVRLPALVRGDELITATGLFGQVIRKAQQIEQSPGGLSAGMFIGNPFTDVPDLACYSLVTTDGDAPRAEAGALRLANAFWPHRERMQARLTSVSESLQIAAETDGPVVLMDPADATSSGAPGDGTEILAALLQTQHPGESLLPIVDAPAVQAAFAAGVGGTLEIRVGGTCDPRRQTPVAIAARVRLLSDGRFRSESFRQEWDSGPTAVLEIRHERGRIVLVATTRPVHLFDRSLFLAHGQDPRTFDLIVVKSPHCQPHMFAAWAARLLVVDAPGSTSANLRTLGHVRARRPLFPLDPDVAFVPQVATFSRAVP